MAGKPKAAWGKTQAKVPPDGTVRRSQTVTTFGPGATMDLVKQAVLVGGLDFWFWNREAGVPVIQEPRLRDALARRFEDASRPLSVQAAFLEPPAGDDRSPSRGVGVQVLEFPTWFVCQNAGCRALTGRSGLDLKDGRYRHQCTRAAATECVPVRFLGACKRGHIEEWPWASFVHTEDAKPRCSSVDLVLDEGPTGDFSQIFVRCKTCHRSAALSTAYGRKLGCGGERPWLGSEGKETCDEELRLLVRTASNSYFPQVVSALSVPDPGHEIDDKISAVWDFLEGVTPEDLQAIRRRPRLAVLAEHSDAEILAGVARRTKGATREPLRTAEYRQFSSQPKEVRGQLPPEDEAFFAREAVADEPLPRGIAKLVLAQKLREVRAQIGFTRIEPVTPDLQGEFDLGVESARLGLMTDWLPATEVRGEGVLVQLDEALVRAWEARAEVALRERALRAGYDAWRTTVSKAPEFPGTRFYLLHSLAHLLVSAISLECGYAASAIRERIYCASASSPVPMAGILLSTGSSGTDGTLGGLVEQGRRVRHHLRRAYDLGVLCSNDPVCASHTPAGDHAERFLEGAACHGCLFIAECSCEWFNRYLDRALVVPTIGHSPKLAFFSERP